MREPIKFADNVRSYSAIITHSVNQTVVGVPARRD